MGELERRDLSRYTEIYGLASQWRELMFDDQIRIVPRVARAGVLYSRMAFVGHYWGAVPAWRMWRRRATKNRRVLPDFACVGAIKSGTSDLATNLFAHPSIVPPFAKEVFADDPESWRPYYPTVAEMDQSRRATGAARTGYFTPWFSHRSVAASYRAAVPDAKVVLMLRDPVDRAYSHYKWEIWCGGPKTLRRPEFRTYADFVDLALSRFPEPAPTCCGEPVLHAGLYAERVGPWLTEFDRASVRIVRAEEYFADPASVLAGIYEFLGLKPTSYAPSPAVNENVLTMPIEDGGARERLAQFYRPHNLEFYSQVGRDFGWV